MSDFTAIGQLVTEARNLLDSIKGGAIRTMQTQFDGLKQQLTDKLDAVTPELTSFINQQKVNVNSIFSEPDKRYQVLHTQSKKVVVGGTVNKWYPVVISINNVLTSLSLSHYTHFDESRFGRWNGALNLDMRVCGTGTGTGGYNGCCLVDRYSVSARSSGRVLPDSDIPFVGRMSTAVGTRHVVLWLRGETSYDLACDDGQVKFDVHDDEVPFSIPGRTAVLEPIDVSSGVDVSVPSVGYIRGE
ncbi:hypothetical protein [Vibrio diabolicus]|uniref:hypothetical protein n=1 Tax=Vibrio diabolicus TaxID=50719 RepID=UPI0037529A44